MIKLSILAIALLCLLCLVLGYIIFAQRKQITLLKEQAGFESKRADDIWKNLEETLSKQKADIKKQAAIKAA